MFTQDELKNLSACIDAVFRATGAQHANTLFPLLQKVNNAIAASDAPVAGAATPADGLRLEPTTPQ